AAAFDGMNYLVAWRDARVENPRFDLYGGRVDSTGSVLDPNGLVFSATGTHEGGVAVARGPSDSAVVVYSRIGSDPPYGGAPRARARSAALATPSGWPSGGAERPSRGSFATVTRGHAPPSPHRGDRLGPGRSGCGPGPCLLHTGPHAGGRLLAPGPVHGARARRDPRAGSAAAGRPLCAQAGALV